MDLARRVLAGDVGLGPGLYYVSPLYIYFLSAGLWVFDSFTAVRLLQILLGTASVAFIYLMAREWSGQRAAWIAGGLAAFTGLFTFYESILLQAAIDPVLTSGGLLALTLALKPPTVVTSLDRERSQARDARTRPKRPRAKADSGTPAGHGKPPGNRVGKGWFALSGLVFGLAALNRPNMLVGAVAIVAALILVRRIRPAALLAAALLAAMTPVAVRNLVVGNEWSLASSHGGLNFYIGNNGAATGFYRQVQGISPTIAGQQRDVRRVAERALGHALSDGEASDYFFGLAWAWIREHPGDALKLFARKLGYTFHAQHIALPHSYPFYAYDTGSLLRLCAVGPWLLVPLGLVGLMVAAPAARRHDYLVWVSFVPGYASGVAAFFVAERYRLPLLVPLCVGAGAALDGLLRAWPRAGHGRRQEHGSDPLHRLTNRQRTTRLVAAGAGFAVLFALANWRHGLHDGRWEEGLRMAQRLVILERYDEADRWVERLEDDAPRPGMAHHGVGLQLLVEDEPARAVVHLSRAQELDPSDAGVEYALGQALLRAERAKEAVPHLRRGFDAGAPVPLAGYDLALALQSVGDLSGAADVIRRIRPGEEDDVEVWLRLGRLASQVQAPDAAEPFFRQAVRMRPDQASARQQLGLNLAVLGNCEEAARELAEAVRLDPRDPDSLSHLAYCEIQLGRLAEGRAHAEAALALNPGNDLATRLLAALRRQPHD
ncbi:MAG TPA: tetratricopeptide repeat protein [Vicinamibacterales bacterium]|nr:tetratricopeptide repeat protein [Vicinamibacterales bacterium]